MNRSHPASVTKIAASILAAATMALAGCNQYSTPVIQSSSTAPGTAASVQNGASTRSADPLNSQADPNETTGSVGGSPGGTSSIQTVPSSSNGVR